MLFTRDRNFYRTLFHLMIIVVFQNIIAYSINMADNLMLGMYSQSSLSGAATVNQIQFLLQQMTLAIGDTLVIVASQYWGQKKTKPIRTFTGIALATGLILGLTVFILTTLFSREILMLFTKKESYIIQGMDYLSLIRFTYPLFVLSTILMAALRSVETVSIALKISILSLIVDVSINYTLIFGKFGFPEMGTKGAAVGTLVARILELVIVVIYLIFADHKLKLFCKDFLHFTKEAFSRFFKILWPSFLSNTLWALATPIQTGINAYQMADQILIILSIVMVGMSYQMPTGIGIIKGGGDVKYMMYLNLISTWAIVMPLSFLGAFVWKLPVPMVVLLLNSDQLFKCIPTYLYVKKDQWIKVLV